MMKLENKFRVAFAKEFRAWLLLTYPSIRLRVQKHADSFTTGIPDLDIILSGMTVWVECKCLPAIAKRRKIDDPRLQRQKLTLADITEAGAPAGLLVGLYLGPRKGYLATFYPSAPGLPTHVDRDAFRSFEVTFRYLIAMAHHASRTSYQNFNQAVHGVQVVRAHDRYCGDDPVGGEDSVEDGC